jgi:hypothetical protein
MGIRKTTDRLLHGGRQEYEGVVVRRHDDGGTGPRFERRDQRSERHHGTPGEQVEAALVHGADDALAESRREHARTGGLTTSREPRAHALGDPPIH